MPILIPTHSMLKPHGTVHVFGGDGPEHTRDTVMCAHCNRHGVFAPGCGKSLGKCLRCMGSLCPGCARRAESEGCVPIEERLDLYESGAIDVL